MKRPGLILLLSLLSSAWSAPVFAQSEAVSDQPEAVSDQMEAVSDQPEAVSDQMEAVSDQTETVSDQPAALSDQTVAVSDQTVAASAQPAAQRSPWAIEDNIVVLINAYRQRLGLPPVVRSLLLDRVARAHVQDLASYHPEQSVNGGGFSCSLHSWSSHGSWRPVCYTGDQASAAGMWNKPNEITRGAFRSNGYEIAMSADFAFSAQFAVSGWRGSPDHDAVMAERGVWAGIGWRSVGVGVGPGYAVVWFADVPDASAPDISRPTLSYVGLLSVAAQGDTQVHDDAIASDAK